MTPLRFALIGTGGIAAAYEQAFKNLRDARIAAVCDTVPEKAQAFAERLACTPYMSVFDLLAEEIDAAIVCTPPATHEPIAITLLKAGVHVLCEKPLATSIEGAHRMLDAARCGGALLTMASKFRYVNDVRTAKDLLDMGAIGDLIFIENAFASRVDMSCRWNGDPHLAGGGVLIDNGTHAVDILRFFMGDLLDVQIVEGRRIQGLPVEDTVRVFVRNAGGVLGTSDLSWSIDKEMTTYLRLYGSDGTILVGWNESKYRRGKSEWHVFGSGYNKIAAFTAQVRNFCEAIRHTGTLLVTPRDALASVEVISAAYAALHRSRWEIVARSADAFALLPLPAEAS